MRRELAIHHFSHRRRRQHTAPPSFSRDTELQDHATLSVPCPMTVSLTLPFDHPGKAEPTMNGLGHRPPLNIVLRHDLGEGRNRISQSLATRGCRRDTVRGGAVATGVATPIDGQRICSPHGRVASRDTTVPDPSTASPDAVPQSPDWQSSSPRGIPGNSYSLDAQECRAELFAGHPELEEEGGGSRLPMGTRNDQTGERATAQGTANRAHLQTVKQRRQNLAFLDKNPTCYGRVNSTAKLDRFPLNWTEPN